MKDESFCRWRCPFRELYQPISGECSTQWPLPEIKGCPLDEKEKEDNEATDK